MVVWQLGAGGVVVPPSVISKSLLFLFLDIVQRFLGLLVCSFCFCFLKDFLGFLSFVLIGLIGFICVFVLFCFARPFGLYCLFEGFLRLSAVLLGFT